MSALQSVSCRQKQCISWAAESHLTPTCMAEGWTEEQVAWHTCGSAEDARLTTMEGLEAFTSSW